MGSLNRMSHEEYERLKKINAELKERQQQLRAEAEQRVKLAADLQKYNNVLDFCNDVLEAKEKEDLLILGIDEKHWVGFETVMYRYLDLLAAAVLAEHSGLLDRLVGSEQQSA